MVSLGGIISAEDIPAREGFDAFEPGQYTGIITSSEMKPTSKGGEMLVLTIDVQENNRKIFERLNIKNDNETAVKIAYQTLGEIMEAVGKKTIKDSEELHGKRFTMDIVVDPAKPWTKDGVQQPGSPQNRVKKYSAYGQAGAIQATGAQTSAPVQQAATPSTAPWKRSA